VSEKRIVRFKVFLLDFADCRAPQAFSQAWLQQLMFSSRAPATTPDALAEPLDQTVYEYFWSNTDGWLRTIGVVTPWASSNLRSRDVPHWNGGTMAAPEQAAPGTTVDYGESWPVIVAETLRRNGFTSNRFTTARQLRDAVLALPGGGRADRVVFLHSDVSSGGAKRSFARMREQLQRMSLPNVRNRTIPGGNGEPWSTLWDDGWAGLPDMLITPILSLGLGGNLRQADGTYANPGNNTNITIEGTSILVHEMGHLAMDLPDLYGGTYGPWGHMCIMGGPRAETNFYHPIGSLCLHKAGYLDWIKKSREHHRLRVRPYETHREAVRLTNGPPGSQEWLVVSNRQNLTYNRRAAPTDLGRGMFAYRWDPHRRTRMLFNGDTVWKESSAVRSSDSESNSAMLWTGNETIGGMPARIFDGAGTLRNSRGELWFTADQIAFDGPDMVTDLGLRAMRLVTEYHRATWTGEGPGVAPVQLKLDRFGSSDGHVVLQSEKHAVSGTQGLGLYLHPRWMQDGKIRGRYPLSSMAAGPLTLYAKLGVADEATASDGVRIYFSTGGETHSIRVQPGEVRKVCMSFTNPGDHLDVIVHANGTATRDWAYLVDAWIVSDAPRAYDFLANVENASWRGGAGNISVNGGGSPRGEVSTRSWRRMFNGETHFGQTAYTHVNWNANGFVEGTYSDVPVPANGAFLRGTLGWAAGRRVNDDGVKIKVQWRTSTNGTWAPLMGDTDYNADPRRPGPDNDLMFLEVPLPSGARGRNCDFRFRVEANGSSTQDWLAWTKLALTTA